MRPASAASLASVVVLSLLGGCFSVGSTRLGHDQLEYARALADAKKRATLANIVAMRYAEVSAFVNTTQIIAAYSLETTGNGTGGPAGTIGGSFTYSTKPTFTFTPSTGEAYASTYVRALSPSLILPLAQGGAPIDLVLRLAVQSVGNLHNTQALAGARSGGTASFFELLHVLRRLQMADALSLRYESDGGGRVFVSLDVRGLSGADADDARRDAADVRRLLGLAAGVDEFEIVYGRGDLAARKVGVVTRSLVGILANLGAQIEVDPADVASGRTQETVPLLGGERRATIVVRSGGAAPSDAFATIAYGGRDYWIARDDFDSKYAFSVLQNVMALAETTADAKAPLVTIPAN